MATQLSIDKSKTAILVMDFQRRQLSLFSDEFQKEIMARTSTVLDRARQGGIAIIHVEVQRGERTPETEIHPLMLPKPGEPLLTKKRVGPFSTTNLDKMLQERNIDTLVVTGLRTSGCILTTIRWAADIDYKLIVLSDCCADPDEEVHQILMEKVFPPQASVVTATEFIQIL